MNYLFPSTFTDSSPFDDAFNLNSKDLQIDRDVLGKAHDPDSLAKRIATARRQIEEGLPVDYVGRADETT